MRAGQIRSRNQPGTGTNSANFIRIRPKLTKLENGSKMGRLSPWATSQPLQTPKLGRVRYHPGPLPRRNPTWRRAGQRRGDLEFNSGGQLGMTRFCNMISRVGGACGFLASWLGSVRSSVLTTWSNEGVCEFAQGARMGVWKYAGKVRECGSERARICFFQRPLKVASVQLKDPADTQ